MKNLKKMLCFVLVCVLIGSLLPMTAAAEDIKITSMEFSVENLKVGEKGTALKAHVAGDQPITLENLATLRYDDAGEPGSLVKSNLLERGEIYWLCVNPVVKAGYSLTPYVMLQKESWTINGLPYGMAIDKVVQSGNQVRFRLTPMVEEIDTVNITGLRAPQLGQTVEEYYIALDEDMFNGTFKTNGFTLDEDGLFGNLKWDGGWLCDETKAAITDDSKQITEGTYYLVEAFVPIKGCTFANDFTVTVADAADVETKLDGNYLYVRAKYEVAAPCTITYDYESQEDVVKQFDKGISLYDAAVTFAPPADTKAGYVFDKWVLSEDTSTDSLEEPESPSRTKIIGDVRFVPHWLKYYDEIHFEFSGYELGANISDGVLTDNIDGYAPQKMPDLWGGNNYVIVADKGGKPDMTDPTTIFKVVTGKFEANTDYWLMVVIGGEGRTITGDIKLDAYGIDKYFLDSPECTDKWWYGEGEAECAFFKLKPLTPITYTITFDPNGGSVTPTTKQTDTDGWLTGLPTPTHSDPNKLFDGWHTSKTSYSQVADECKFSEDTTLYAHWKDKPAHSIAEVYIESIQTPAAGVMPSNHVTITTAGVHGITDSGDTFWVRYDAATNNLTDLYEDETFVDSVPFRAGETYLLMLVMEAEPNYGFTPDVKVFYKGAELPALSMSDATASATLHRADDYIVVIINPGDAAPATYTVTFDSDGGSAVAKQTVEEGKAAAKPADPTRSGYTFKGWYLGDSKYDFSKAITGNITLKAKWEKITVAPTTYTVTFDSNGGSAVAKQTVESGKAASKPADPTRSGYTFKGWFLGDSKYDFSKAITGNITLKAKWEKNAQPTTPTEPTVPDTPTTPTEPTVPDTPTTPTEPTVPEPQVTGVTRLAGADRYKTAFLAADQLKAQLGKDKFDTVVVASGTEFADALSGSYLASVKNAPMLLVRNNKNTLAQVKEYIQKNLNSGGTVYILGGEKAVPKAMESGLDGFQVKRLGGNTRYDTNLLILKEAGVDNKDILVCTGKGFADSLSASAAKRPILLVKDSLNSAQKDFLNTASGKKYVIGGKEAVNEKIENALKSYGEVKRLGGNTRYETSVLVAKEFFSAPKAAVLAYAQNFPDGLSGGALACGADAPLILTASGKEKAAAAYTKDISIKAGYTLGGTGLINDKAVKSIFAMAETDTIAVIK